MGTKVFDKSIMTYQHVYEIKLNGLEYLFSKNKSFIRKKNNQ